MQDLIVEITDLRKTLNFAIEELKRRGISKAEAECDYRKALAKKMLELRAESYPASIISDLARGGDIADLKLKRDLSEGLWESCLQKIYSLKLEIEVVQKQIEAERKGV